MPGNKHPLQQPGNEQLLNVLLLSCNPELLPEPKAVYRSADNKAQLYNPYIKGLYPRSSLMPTIQIRYNHHDM